MRMRTKEIVKKFNTINVTSCSIAGADGDLEKSPFLRIVNRKDDLTCLECGRNAVLSFEDCGFCLAPDFDEETKELKTAAYIVFPCECGEDIILGLTIDFKWGCVLGEGETKQ